jgi:hypothetical protein
MITPENESDRPKVQPRIEITVREGGKVYVSGNVPDTMSVVRLLLHAIGIVTESALTAKPSPIIIPKIIPPQGGFN